MTEPTPSPIASASRSTGAVRLERRLAAAPGRVWAMWTEPARLERWLGPVRSGCPGPGATFVLQMERHGAATCTVMRWEPEWLLELAWIYTGEPQPSRLRIELRPEAGGTRLVLEHDQLLGDEHGDYATGWERHLHALVAAVAAANTDQTRESP